MNAWWRRWRDRMRLKEAEFAFLFASGAPVGECMCVDTEATSLDPEQAELLTLAVVPVVGHRILMSQASQWLIRPRGVIDPERLKEHGLRPRDVDQGLPEDAAVRQFLHVIGNRPLMGYYLEFDVAMVNKTVRPMLGISLPNRCIEVSSLYHDHKMPPIPRSPVDLRFHAMREDLGVPLIEGQGALGRAMMTAMMYLRLQT